jgi:hypothetical protein
MAELMVCDTAHSCYIVGSDILPMRYDNVLDENDIDCQKSLRKASPDGRQGARHIALC